MQFGQTGILARQPNTYANPPAPMCRPGVPLLFTRGTVPYVGNVWGECAARWQGSIKERVVGV